MIEDQQPEDPELEESPEEPEKPEYWAATLDPADMATEIRDRAKEYYETLSAAGLLELYALSHAYFYSLGPQGHEGSRIIQFGDDGEKLGIRANHLRSIGRYIFHACTSDKVVVLPKAVNASAKARTQVPTAKRTIEYYHYTKRFHKILCKVALRALIYGKGYLFQAWDPGAAQGGDLIYRAYSPLEVISDLDRSEDEHDWFVVRPYVNKHDLAAQYPYLAEDLVQLAGSDLDADLERKICFGFNKPKYRRSTDLVPTYHFMHARTPALPDGRYVIVAGDLILFDGPLPYKSLPVSEMVPEEFVELGGVGYSSLWDLIGLQQYYDAITSTGMSNMDALGHNDILLPEGVELGVEEIRDGLNVIRYPAGEANKPSMLEKFQLREEYFKLRDSIRQDMETLPGVNQVARGQPEASLKSGSALALVEAQAIKFQTGTIRAFNYLVTDSSTKTIEILAAFCPPERIKEIAGANDPDGVSAFCDGKLDMIGQVECEQVNPIFSTLGGRLDAANNSLERGLVKTASEYYGMIETGRPEVASADPAQQSLYYQHVREVLMTGPQVEQYVDEMSGQPAARVMGLPVTILDDPQLGLLACRSVLNSVENRSNDKIVASTVAFAQETVKVWRTAPIDVLTALGYPPAPSTVPPPADPSASKGQGPAPDKSGKLSPPNGQGKQMSDHAPDQGSGMPSLPKPAQNPLEDTNG